VSDRLRARLVVAGTSTFLSVLVAAVLLVGLGALAGRLSVPTLPGESEAQVSLPVLTDIVPAADTGLGAIPPEPDAGTGTGDGTPSPPPGTDKPGNGPPTKPDPPAVGLTARGDVGNLGLVGLDVPVRVGRASGRTSTTRIKVLGVDVGIQTSDNLVQDVVCLLVCPRHSAAYQKALR
jgi:hypothetical protein